MTKVSERMMQRYIDETQNATYKTNIENVYQERNDKRMFNEVFLHLDLKGAPPTI